VGDRPADRNKADVALLLAIGGETRSNGAVVGRYGVAVAAQLKPTVRRLKTPK
jgi:hypothetical protein